MSEFTLTMPGTTPPNPANMMPVGIMPTGELAFADKKEVVTYDPRAIFAPEDFKPNWIENLPDEVYHADRTAVNSSSLKAMAKSARAFHGAFFSGRIKEPTDAMKFGTLAHLAILQGAKFRDRYIVQPDFGDMRSSKNRASRDAWLAEVPPTHFVVTEDERDDLFGMIDSVLSHERAFALLSKGSPEIAGYWRDAATGIRLRMKADFISFDLGALVDVKTTRDCRWPEFRRSVESLRYDIQMAMYADGTSIISGKPTEHKVWLAIEHTFPYEVACHEVPPQYELTGNYEYRSALQRVKRCVELNEWPQGQPDIEFGEMSAWFYRGYELKGVFSGDGI